MYQLAWAMKEVLAALIRVVCRRSKLTASKINLRFDVQTKSLNKAYCPFQMKLNGIMDGFIRTVQANERITV